MTLAILCVDDQREVLSALSKDLATLGPYCEVVEAESASEAEAVMTEMEDAGVPLAVIISDQVMPGTSGVELLSAIRERGHHPQLRMILLTGQATHGDTIRAINQAHVQAYIAKPWELDSLLETVRSQLTGFVLESGLDHREYLPVLDQELLLEHLRRHGADR